MWGRDREGKFTDRLAIDYRIEVADASGEWRTVADASDRAKFDANATRSPSTFSTKGLERERGEGSDALACKRRQLRRRRSTAAANGQKVFAGTFRTPDDIHLLNRGDPEQPKDEVVPAVLSALGNVTLPKETAEQQRRMALADWIASPQNPLTARVMVNRIWQGHFGTGLVETPSDFGRNGTKPTHPELLDWLAQRIHPLRLVGEAHAPAHRALGHLSAVAAGIDASRRGQGRRRPPALALSRRAVSKPRRSAIRCSP